MNKHQKIAFGAPVALAVAFLIALMYGTDGLGLMILVTFGIALLTLPITWRIILTVIKMVAETIALIGHGIGKLGDMVADFAFTSREKFSSQTSRVPDWDTLGVRAGAADDSRVGIDELLQPHPVA